MTQVVWSEHGEKRSAQYLHTDGLGSVRLSTGDGGAVTRAYEPFGKRIAPDGAALSAPVGDLRLGLTGPDHDDELGLINLGGRLYDPQLKRVLTPDSHVTVPLFGQSFHRYSYAMNDPVNVVDPTGYDGTDAPDCQCSPSPPIIDGNDPGLNQTVVSGMSGGGYSRGYSGGSSGEVGTAYGHVATDVPPKLPPVVKSDIDGASSPVDQGSSWRDSTVIQGLGGFAVGVGLGVVPGGGQVDQLATGAHVIDEGTQAARIGKALGEIVGGFAVTGVGMSGEAVSWALNAAGVGAVLGVPGAAVSAAAVVGGVENVTAGAENLTQALSMGSGRGGGD